MSKTPAAVGMSHDISSGQGLGRYLYNQTRFPESMTLNPPSKRKLMPDFVRRKAVPLHGRSRRFAGGKVEDAFRSGKP